MIVSSESQCGNFDDYFVKKGRRSVFSKLLMIYYMNFPSAEGLSSFSEATLKRLPTAT